MRVSWIGIHLFPAQIRKNPLGIARVLGDKPVHFGDRTGLALRRRLIVEGEAQPEQNRALKRLPRVLRQRRRAGVQIPLYQIRRNPPRFPPIQHRRPRSAVQHMHDGHHHRRLPRPDQPPGRVRDCSARRDHRPQPALPRIALTNCVGRDQSQATARPQQREGSAEEMRHQIGVAVSTLMQRLQPVQIMRAVAVDQRVLPREWRIANDRVEAARAVHEHLGELDLPMEWLDRMCTPGQDSRPVS